MPLLESILGILALIVVIILGIKIVKNLVLIVIFVKGMALNGE